MKKRLYAYLLQIIEKLFGIDCAKKIDTKLRFHRTLDLKNPKTLADKVSYIELHCQSPLAPKCTDKYEVRSYVKGKGLEEILVPVVGGPWTSFEEIDFAKLPDRFVLKATHGCKMNYFVKSKSELNIQECRQEVNKWLKTTYGTYSMEPHYKKIPHRIYAEKYLDDMSKMVDYKFFCFNGKPKYVHVISNRCILENGAMACTMDLFDMNWNSVVGICGLGTEVPGDGAIKKPETFNQMQTIAATLSSGFDFVRVDLYEGNSTVLFGEMTFTPACGVFPYFTEDLLKTMGEKLIVNR